MHFGSSNHLITIYEPEELRKDIWLNPLGKVAERLDEIFGGEGAFDKYVEQKAHNPGNAQCNSVYH
ncbi:hypothetical protein FACS1894156_8900 [Bacteroidia bacterium]|nr:hypothetical protein FACS1894156_8900 [Bacteroidia bacterium]